jgi:sugar diacid utilization regulator
LAILALRRWTEERAHQIIEILADSHASGVLVAVPEGGEQSRPRLRNLAERKGFTLGFLAGGTDANSVANELNRVIAVIRTDHAVSSLHGAKTLQILADTLGQLLGNSVTIETTRHVLLAATPANTDVDRIREETILRRHGHPHANAWITQEGYMAALLRSDHAIKIPANAALGFSGRVAIRVANEDQVLAVIWAMDTARALGERDYQLMRQAAHAAAAILIQEQDALQREAQLRIELLDDVVNGRITLPENVRTVARGLGWDIDGFQRAIIVAIDDFEDFRLRHSGGGAGNLKRVLSRLTRLVRLEAFTVDPDAVVGSRGGRVVVLGRVAEGDEGKAVSVRFGECVLRRVWEAITGMTVTVGIGRTVPTFEQLAESFLQAERAARLGSSLWGGNQVVHYDDLGVYRVLAAAEADDDVIGPALQRIIDYDARHGTEFVPTLGAYFDCMGRLQAAAAQLNLHRNTLQYRIQRIQQLVGVSLDDPDSRLALELGLKMLHLRPRRRPAAQQRPAITQMRREPS